MVDIQAAEPGEEAPPGAVPPFADAGLSILAATEAQSVAAALLHGLRGNGLDATAVAWTRHGRLQFEPAEADTPANHAAARAMLAGQPSPEGARPEACLLAPDAADARAVLLAAPGALAAASSAVAPLLALAGRRLSELFSIQRLHASVQDLEQAEQLQHALFAIADMAASDRDMRSLLHGLHGIIGRLMYAENFYIALYHRDDQTVQFIYIADSEDSSGPGPEERIPIAELERGLTCT